MADPYGTGGLLGGFQGFSPLTNFGLGLLSQSGPSLTPQSPWQAIGKAAQYTSEAQQQALQNALFREKISASAAETKAKTALMEGVKSGAIVFPGVNKDTAAALIASGDESLLAKFIPQALTPEAAAMAAAGQPGVALKEAELKKEQGLQKTEEVTANRAIADALEAKQVIDRLEAGPVPLGSTEAAQLESLTNPETGYLNISPQDLVRITGKNITPEQAHAFQTDWNRFHKLSAKAVRDQQLLQTQQEAVGGTSRVTNFGLDFIKQSNLNTSITGEAATSILKDFIQKQLDIAGAREWKLPNAGAGQAFIDKYADIQPMDYSRPAGAPTPVAGSGGVGLLARGAGIATGLANRGLDWLQGVGQPTPEPPGPQVPQIAPQTPAPAPAPGGISVAPPAAEAAPAAPQPGPAARGVKTQAVTMVPPQPASKDAPAFPGGPLPVFNRSADGQRAVPHGWFLTKDGGLWYNP